MTTPNFPPRSPVERWLIRPAYRVSCYLIATPFLVACVFSLLLCLVTLLPIFAFWYAAKAIGIAETGPFESSSS